MQSAPWFSQIGRTSIDIVCQDASKSLWPSRRLDIPALPLHGSNLRNGVRFSVQTTSCGRDPCSRWRFCEEVLGCTPSGSNVRMGRMVLVESIKFKEAQNKPDNAFVNDSQREFALRMFSLESGLETRIPYSSSEAASTHAHNSTPVPPSRAPCHGLLPHTSSSQRPKLNLMCNSLVCVCCNICPKDLGKNLKF